MIHHQDSFKKAQDISPQSIQPNGIDVFNIFVSRICRMRSQIHCLRGAECSKLRNSGQIFLGIVSIIIEMCCNIMERIKIVPIWLVICLLMYSSSSNVENSNEHLITVDI